MCSTSTVAMAGVTLLALALGTLFRAASPPAIEINNDSEKLNATIKATCELLQRNLGTSTITLPSDESYKSLADEPWSQTAWKTPFCIATPSTTAQVQQLLRTLTDNQIPFAVRSGGHSPNPFDANIDSGVLVATDKLVDLDYDPAAGLASLGPGLRWDAVYTYLDTYNVTVVGGRVMDVGVGGLVLGSGLSYLSNLYGLACDNVEAFEIVLADGNAVTATAATHSDLFWGLKGGSNNFGIVTKFTVRTYPIFRVWGGMQVFPLDQASDILQALYDYQTVPDKDPYANCIVNVLATNSTVLLTLVYLKPVEKPDAFASFYKFTPLVDTTGFYTLHEIMAMFPLPADITRWTWYTNSFEPNAQLYQHISAVMTPSDTDVATVATLPYGTLVAAVQPIDRTVVSAGGGGNALGLEAKDQLWFSFNLGWVGDEHDAVADATMQRLNKRIDGLTRDADARISYLFMNDANWRQPVIASYGPDNAQRLRMVQQKYDPHLVFQKLVSGGQKIPIM